MPKQRRNQVPDSICNKIVDMVCFHGMRKAEVARRFEYPWTTVDTIVRKFQDTGKTKSQRKRGGALTGSKVKPEHLEMMVRYLEDHPAATLHEIRAHLMEHGSLELSISYLSKVLADRCHVTLRRLHVEHERYNNDETILARQAWVQQYQYELQALSTLR